MRDIPSPATLPADALPCAPARDGGFEAGNESSISAIRGVKAGGHACTRQPASVARDDAAGTVLVGDGLTMRRRVPAIQSASRASSNDATVRVCGTAMP